MPGQQSWRAGKGFRFGWPPPTSSDHGKMMIVSRPFRNLGFTV